MKATVSLCSDKYVLALYMTGICYMPQEIDFPNESIKLSNAAPTEVKDLPKRIPRDAARYHFFLYKHSHEGDYLESTGRTAVQGRRKSSSIPFCIDILLQRWKGTVHLICS